MKDYRGRTEIGTEHGSAASVAFITPLPRYLETSLSSESSESFGKMPITSCFRDSIESLDSVVDSDCTHGEDEIPASVGFVDKFLMEHLNFLSQSTQPQEIKLVYDTH